MLQCGAYLRLSREEEGAGESNSIQAQRMMIHQYMQENPEMRLAGEWVDDGYSGSNFHRPGFQQMMLQVLEGEIQCIIVKDLSRFGREYIETGKYIQQIFPMLGVRFIAVIDHYDSEQSEFMEQALLMPFMNLFNDAYCRDISQKVRSQQHIRRMRGEYVGSFAVYGYQKSQTDYHCLVEDKEAAGVVRAIYWLRLSGLTAEKIAILLNQVSVLSPMAYKEKLGSRYVTGFSKQNEPPWSATAIRRILQDEVYRGLLIQGKDEKISYKIAQRRKKERDEWICVENKVPAIIPSLLFWKVQQIQSWKIHCPKGEWYCRSWDGIVWPKPRSNHDKESRGCRLSEKLLEKLEQWILQRIFQKRTGETVWKAERDHAYSCQHRLYLLLLFQRVELREGVLWVQMAIKSPIRK